jgi:hypothetical protein
MIFKKEDKKWEDWHKMKTRKFPPDEMPELENYKESLTINGSTTIIEEEYEQTMIGRRQIPTKRNPIYVVTKGEKIAHDNMEIMMNFIRKHFQGRIYRKPMDIDEFIEDIYYYFFTWSNEKVYTGMGKEILQDTEIIRPGRKPGGMEDQRQNK